MTSPAPPSHIELTLAGGSNRGMRILVPSSAVFGEEHDGTMVYLGSLEHPACLVEETIDAVSSLLGLAPPLAAEEPR